MSIVDSLNGLLERMEASLQVQESEQEGKFFVATKDLPAGEILFVETPLVSWRFSQRDPTIGFRCDYCMHHIPLTDPEFYCDKCDVAIYCTEKCQAAGRAMHTILCKAEGELRDFNEELEKEGSCRYLFSVEAVARCVAFAAARYKRIQEQYQGAVSLEDAFTAATQPFNSLVAAPELQSEDIDTTKWCKMVRKTLKAPLTQFFGGGEEHREVVKGLLSDDTLLTLLGQLMFNATSINLIIPPATRSAKKKEEKGITKGQQTCTVGAAIYTLQSCFNHSCAPNASLKFSDNDNVVSVVAAEKIPKGDCVTISYLDRTALENEPVAERRKLLAPYLFLCQCPRCVAEDRKRQQREERQCEEVLTDNDDTSSDDEGRKRYRSKKQESKLRGSTTGSSKGKTKSKAVEAGADEEDGDEVM